MRKLIFLFSFIMLIGFSSAIDFTDGLQAYYNFDQGLGTSLTDITGNGADGELFNMDNSNWVTGKLGSGALFFDGVSEYVNTTFRHRYETTDNISINFWMNTSETNIASHEMFGVIAGDGSGLGHQYNTGMVWDSRFRDSSSNTNRPTSTTAVNGGVWKMITMVKDTSLNEVSVWIDGVNEDNVTITMISAIDFLDKAIYLGARNGIGTAVTHTHGTLDEFSIWSKALDTQDISDLYNGGTGLAFLEDVVITLNSPANNFIGVVDGDIIFNSTSEVDAGLQLVNTTLFIDGVLNETKLIIGTMNTTIFTKTFSTVKSYNWTIVSCNDDSLCSNTTQDFSIDYLAGGDIIFPSSALIGDSIELSFPFNITSTLSVSSANLVYNGTSNSVSVISLGNGRYNLTKTLTVPEPFGLIPFYFNVTLSNSEEYNSSEETITINPIGIDDCSVYTNVLYNFTSYDEQTKSILNGAGASVDHLLNLELFNSDKSVSLVTFAKEYSSTNPAMVCLQNPLTSQSEMVIDLEMQYTAGIYATEYYNIFSDSIDVSDLNTIIPLYILENTSSQEFQITYRDSSFLPVSDAVIQIQRKYVSEGIFRTVEQPKTDYDGKTLAHLELDDVVYNFIVLVENEVVAVFNNVIAVCQNPTFNDCEIFLTETESFVQVTEFDNLDDFTFTGPLFDESTRTVSALFSITSGSSSTVVLNVTLFDALGETFVCDSSLISSSGSLACVVPTSFGNATIVATLYQDGDKKALGTFRIGQTPSNIYGNNLIWVGMIIFFSFLGLGISGNPVVTSAFMILTAIVLMVFNVVSNTGFIGAGATILWFIIAVIILMIKGARRI